MEAIEVSNLSKRFGTVQALDRVSLTVAPGEIHALVGQNGSGKSTLVKILAGYESPDKHSKLSLWGTPVTLPVADPAAHGVAVIHQDLGLANNMTALENIGVATRFRTRTLQPISWGLQRTRALSVCAELEIDVDLGRTPAGMSNGEKVMICVARALIQLNEQHAAAPILILDESTAYFSQSDVKRVYGLIRKVVSRGGSALLISHSVREVSTVADRVTVLRDGKVVRTFDSNEIEPGRIANEMLGRTMSDFYPDRSQTTVQKSVALELNGVSGNVLDNVSLTLHAGEILGVTGLVGMGQDELPYLAARQASGRRGRRQFGQRRSRTEGDKSARGPLQIGLVPGNRHRDGLWLAGTAIENVSIASLKGFWRWGRLNKRAERKQIAAEMVELNVRPRENFSLPALTFSGGNQQKLVLAKWLRIRPDVLLLHEPTQGVDVAGKKDILELVTRYAADGGAVLLCSADHDEIAHMCDRVIVLRDGRISREIAREELTPASVLNACLDVPQSEVSAE
jgi:ribose transport system ATP-binding protein